MNNAARIIKLQEIMNSPNMSIYRKFTFSNYTPVTPTQEAVHREMSNNHRGYYLFSDRYGVGKTHLLAALALNAIKNGIPSLVISINDPADIEKSAYTIPYLCVDDIGDETSKQRNKKILALMYARYKLYNAGKGHTSFASKYPLDALSQRINAHIVDMIKKMCKPLYLDGIAKIKIKRRIL